MAARLKSLELHGYKTFASHTLLEFSEQITAIVGPNGSGKSNIADSIRWVLGEQSYSLLRGRKTEDMIFAGSEQRSRAGMASATILFDNEDDWLPIDFSEVSITRRAYRDGQNEYLLNGQKVRLKEISELLAQSGLAERTYTIIGQGLVDAALSLRPEERRRFFEEAAGIGLYRRRREESLNRLEATRRNMDRVLDIISEIEPRLTSLEKAAKRAQEYLRVQADLRILLREWYGYHWHRSQQDVVHAQEVYRIQRQRLDQVRIQLSEVEKQNEEQRSTILKLRGDLNTWHSQSASLHRQRENYNRSLAVMDERQHALTEQQNVLFTDLAKLEEEAKAHRQRQDAMKEEHERLKIDLAEAQTQAIKARANLQKKQIERADVEKRLRDLRNTLQNNETRQIRLKAHRVELNDRRNSLVESSKKTAHSLSTEEETFKRVQQKLAQAQEEHSRIEKEFHDMETQLQSIRFQTSQIEKERRQNQEERSKLGAEAARIKSQLDVLEQAERSLSGHSQGSKFIIEATRKGLLQGKYKTLNSDLDVPIEYEKAIAAVLGEFLHSILLDHQTDADLALKLLENGDKGRAVLLPLDLINATDPLLPIADQDCLGSALELIHIGETLKPFLNVLIGDVLIVRDRQAAYRIKKQLSPEARIVTLQGEVFWGKGLIISGRDSSTSLISRPRQKREFQENAAQLKENITIVDVKIQQNDLDLTHQRNLEQELDKRLLQMGAQLNQVVQLSQKVDLEAAQTRQRVEFHRGQVTSLESQNQNVVKEIQGLDNDLIALDGSISQFREQVRLLSRERDAISLEELQTEEVHWNTNAAVITRAVKNAEARSDEYAQTVKNNHQQQEVLRQRLENLTTTLQKLGEDKQLQRGEEQKINEQIVRLQQDIEPAEKVLDFSEKEYARLQNILASSQQTVSIAERNEAQGQIELTRQRESLATLRRRIEEDFGLVAFEFEPEVSGQTPLPLDGIVTQLPIVVELSADIEDGITRYRSQLRRIGAINPEAQKEYQEVLDRSHFLKAQMEDLRKADIDLRQVINELDELMKKEFKMTFDAVAVEFRGMFTRLFGGGTAHLNLTDEDHPTETGIEIEARLPGRREQGLELLSGGERSLTAVALVFALLKISPTPFCVLDEVDAMLDESNVGRFGELLTELSQKTQFIVVTHNRGTVQTANIIYGVTMGRDSASQIISLKLDEVKDEMVR